MAHKTPPRANDSRKFLHHRAGGHRPHCQQTAAAICRAWTSIPMGVRLRGGPPLLAADHATAPDSRRMTQIIRKTGARIAYRHKRCDRTRPIHPASVFTVLVFRVRELAGGVGRISRFALMRSAFRRAGHSDEQCRVPIRSFRPIAPASSAPAGSLVTRSRHFRRRLTRKMAGTNRRQGHRFSPSVLKTTFVPLDRPEGGLTRRREAAKFNA